MVDLMVDHWGDSLVERSVEMLDESLVVVRVAVLVVYLVELLVVR